MKSDTDRFGVRRVVRAQDPSCPSAAIAASPSHWSPTSKDVPAFSSGKAVDAERKLAPEGDGGRLPYMGASTGPGSGGG